jgi:MazG family protein
MAGDDDLGRLFAESAAIMARLRGPGGCPWDQEQTHDSIRKYTLEETYEVLDAIECRDWPNLCEELGDLLLQVLFYAEMAEEAGNFTLVDVLTGLNRKLIRRHPHVFGEEAAAAAGNRASNLAAVPSHTTDGSAAVLSNWQLIKQMEKHLQGPDEEDAEAAKPGYLAGVLRNLPALSEAAKLGSAAARPGFDWPDPVGILEKVREEAAELEAEISPATEVRHAQGVAEEYGDLLFTVANLGRHLKLDPEMALRDANAKFRRRFEAMERASDRALETLSPAELEEAWAAVKLAEAGAKTTTSKTTRETRT